MNKILIVLTISLLFLSGCSNQNIYNTNNYDASRTSNVENTINQIEGNIMEEKPKEAVELSSFSTKIFDKSAGRQNNVGITISKLNGTIINPGEEFSFCNIVGKATSDKGYQKAKIFDSKGNIKQGLGGGNCQVSTTIYNAVKDLLGIEITERHQHSRHVPYIGTGLDAAVAYGAEDLKFKNNNEYPIQIEIFNTENDITCNIKKVSTYQ